MSSLKIHYEVETEHGKVIVDSENPVLHEFSDHGEVWSEPMELIDVIRIASHPFTTRNDDIGVMQWRYCRPIAQKKNRPMNIDELAEIAAKGAIFVRENLDEIAFPYMVMINGAAYVGTYDISDFIGYRLPHTKQILPLEVEL